MKHKIRMIGLDLDGTLLTTQKKITSYTKAVLEEALAKGIVVLVSTGRPISAVPKEILEIPGMKYAVTANGARVLDIETGEVIVENMLSLETAGKVLRIFQKYNTIHEIFIGSEGYTSKSVAHAYEYFKNPSMAEYFMNTRIPVDDVVAEMLKKGEPVDKVQGIFKNEDERKKQKKSWKLSKESPFPMQSETIWKRIRKALTKEWRLCSLERCLESGEKRLWHVETV